MTLLPNQPDWFEPFASPFEFVAPNNPCHAPDSPLNGALHLNSIGSWVTHAGALR